MPIRHIQAIFEADGVTFMGKRVLGAVLAAALLSPALAVIPAASASAEPGIISDGSTTTVELGPDGDVSIVTVNGAAIEGPRSAASAALAEAATWSASFGGSDATLRIVDQTPLDGGRTATRLQQSFAGADVYAGQLVVVTDERGALLTISGGLAEVPATSSWRVAAAVARRAASSFGKVTDVKRVVFDESLVGGEADVSRTAWQLDVVNSKGAATRIFFDANTGEELFREQRKHALSRVVCDALNVRTNDDEEMCHADAAARTEASGPLAAGGTFDATQVNEGFETLGRTSKLFEAIGVDLTNLIGRDAGDGHGKQLQLFVRFCPPKSVDTCPMSNAYWLDDMSSSNYTGGVMYAGDGLAASDDVTAHELAHGVTTATSNLVYANEPGAISESLSDVFGELVDQSELLSSEDPAIEDRWYIGEAIKTKEIVGPVRSMSNPTKSFLGAPPSPDRMGSPFWWTKKSDDGGVHINSGVGNKAAYLMGHGGTFRGITVHPLSIHKLTHLYWEVENRLAPSSRYSVLGAQLRAACSELAAAGTDGYTEADCVEVDAAVRATQMTAQRAKVSSSRSTIEIGNRSKLSLTLTDAVKTGDPRVRSGVPVIVESMPITSETWMQLETKKTNAFGEVSFSVRPMVSTKYRVSVPANGPWSATQAELTVKVQPKLSITRVQRGKSILVTGISRPYVQGANVVLQRRAGGHWKTLSESGVAENGEFTLSSTKAGPRDRLRVVRHANGGLAQAVVNVR